MRNLAGHTSGVRAGRTRFTAAALLGFVWVLAASAPASATTIAISPSLKTVLVGESFSLDVAIADVNDLFDYQFDLNFDPAILQANGISDGGFLTSGGGTSAFSGAFLLTLDNTTGLLTILDSLVGPAPPATGATGGGVLASISFTALALGASSVSLSNLILEDSAGGAIDAQPVDGVVQVNPSGNTPVPEPATLFLLGSGLAVGFRRAQAAARARLTKDH
jgi:Cohesin domain/PEP-CTERM motif